MEIVKNNVLFSTDKMWIWMVISNLNDLNDKSECSEMPTHLDLRSEFV